MIQAISSLGCLCHTELAFVSRESRDQGPYSDNQQRGVHRHIYATNDDVFNEEKMPPQLSKDHLVENNTAPYLKNSEENSKESDQKTESSARVETHVSPKSTMEEKSQPSLSTYYSVNAQIGSARVSASLPRSYQSTDTARLTSVVTPRPFGVHSRGISSLPRSFTVNLSSSSCLCGSLILINSKFPLFCKFVK